MTRTQHHHQRGAVIPLLVGLLPVVFGILGLIIDSGRLYAEQRNMQAAADATALAAAQEIRRDSTIDYRPNALKNASLNGYDGSNAHVEINVPPLTGLMAGDANFVEARISRTLPLYFMRMLGRGQSAVEARAVAGLRADNACVYALNKTAPKALWVTGTANVTMADCGIHVDSKSSTAAVTNGKATVNGGIIEVAGGYSGSGFTPTPDTGADQTSDPLLDLPQPSFGGCNHVGLVKVQDHVDLKPGVYCGGIEVTASGYAELEQGLYVIYGGGITVLGGARVEGASVTFFLTEGPGYPYGPTKFAGSATTQVSAPTEGPYRGILFFQDRGVKTTEIHRFAGSAGTSFNGVVYMVNAPIEWTGTHEADIQSAAIIADTLTFKGSVNIQSLTSASGMLPPLLTVARVVE